MSSAPDHPRTPDGRYFVVRGRLWRLANPALTMERRSALVSELMNARRDLRGGVTCGVTDAAMRAAARSRVDAAKTALGERGPVWWADGEPDYNRKLVEDTPYATWFAALDRSSG